MASHSNVCYVEPNISSSGVYKDAGMNNTINWKVDDEYDRSPRLEDYSIYFNLEVEICSRENISANKTITTDVLILSYRTKPNESASTINFMGGTKVKTGNNNYQPMDYLTTNYADMYVGDLIDYGTTEMIGIKSIDIEFQGACVPTVTIKFTDVRGLSLFQPTELSRTSSYQGINGINSDNVAQSFFQCFFRLPMPRFTMTIKGFYGRPVTYECLCDKFDTNFNSNTGDFDVTTRFIGYSYSFLTDISIDALLAAPYSDYGGKVGNYNKYWDSEIKSGRFTIPNKEKTVSQSMPTLFEIWQEMKILLSKDITEMTPLDYEDSTHSDEIQKLQDIKDLYQRWYGALFDVCTKLYGKDYCYAFKNSDDEYYRILILAKESTTKSLGDDYEQYPDSFKSINEDLYAAVSEYNANEGNFKKLRDVSLDFKVYVPSPLFRNTFLDKNGRVLFNDFDKENRLPPTQVINNVLFGVDYSSSGSTEEEVNNKKEAHKRHVLETIYDDGTDQYIKCYSIEQDCDSITERIKALQADANRSSEDKEKQRRLMYINKKMFSEMSWYPTVENFTRIMMAHLETLMHLMYTTVTNCEGRTASELGVTTGSNGDCVDVNAAKDVIPPFPRVTKNVLGDDGITKVEDAWVGEYTKGTKGFEEVDFISGFFNAIERMEAIKKDVETRLMESSKDVSTASDTYGGVIKHPLSAFDFFITKSPYGDYNEIANDLDFYQFAGKVGIRMFNILSLSHFRKQFTDVFSSDEEIIKIARVEADNFHELTKMNNEKFLGLIRDGVITEEAVYEKLTNVNKSESCPWGKNKLFSADKDDMWLFGYTTKDNIIYPIQDISFSRLNNTVSEIFNQDKITNDDDGISLFTLPTNKDVSTFSTNTGYGNILFTEKIDLAEKILENANSGCDDGYTSFYDRLVSAATFDEEAYTSFFKLESNDGAPSVCTICDKEVTSFEVNSDGFIDAIDSNGDKYTYDCESIGNIGSSAKNGDMSEFTITEIFGIKNGSHDYESSFLKTWSTTKNGQVFFGDLRLEQIGVRTALALLSIKTNYNKFYNTYIGRRNAFLYYPKLVLLQIGAVCFATGGIKNEVSLEDGSFAKALKSNLDVNVSFIPRKISEVVCVLSKQARYQYAKYFHNWVHSNEFRGIATNLETPNDYLKSNKNTNRSVLNQNSEFTKKLTKELLKPVLVINMSINVTKIDQNTRKRLYTISAGKAKTYLKAFIERLSELYRINNTEDSNGNIVRTTDEPKQTTDDMKSELYRYMKQVYDKWIPMSSFDDWKLETFFETSTGEQMGHTFYFIDSYYNRIGDKLLINPKNLMERVEGLLGNSDVNAMMLGFMSDVYGFNRCMLKCVQNFSDLVQPNSMTEMFLPMSFNSIDWSKEVNKYPSFVVVYPYEPSKNLNVANNEFNDDGFMLNDENETPKAIRSKSDNTYKIPAFGVAYGKQYQSYFKSVNVNMKSPIATQQSIKAKHYILQRNANVKSKGVAAQDLYDVYSTQSYTCDVEMMGCAWIQPLMYFVLLNIPMFRGSYLIMKVKHSIKPGDMTTTFTGCRMANMSNKIIEYIFTDDDFMANGGSGASVDRTLKADIDNDCPYKIFPLWGSDGTDLIEILKKAEGGYSSDPDDKDGGCTMRGITLLTYRRHFGQSKTCNDLRNISDSEWWTIFKKGYWDVWQADNIRNKSIANLLVDWTFNSGPGNGVKIPQEVLGITPSLSKESIENTVNAINNYPNQQELFQKLWNRRKSFFESIAIGAKKKYLGGWLNRLNLFSYSDTDSAPSSKDPNDKEDVITAFFNAVNRSAQATPSINVPLKSEVYKFNGVSYLKITQESGNDKLGKVFDMILNSEYYSYVEGLGWTYENGGLETGINPISIYCIVKEKVEEKNKKVWVSLKGSKVGDLVPANITDGNPILLKCLAKHAKSISEQNFKKEVPQMTDLTILENYKPQDCDSLFAASLGDNSSWAKAVQSMGKWYETNVHEYNQKGWSNCALLNGTKVRHDCSGYVSACLQYFGAFKNGFVTSSSGFNQGADIYDILKSKGFTKLDYSWNVVQPYDIIAYNGHVEILAEKGEKPKSWGWGACHDGKNGHSGMPASTGPKPKGDEYKSIWRYS